MSLKELKEAMKEEKLNFGFKQVLKNFNDKKAKKGKVFVAKDSREETIKRLGENNVNFEFSKTKSEISKDLELDFESEVYLIN